MLSRFEEDEMRKLAEFKKKEKQEDKAARSVEGRLSST